MGDTHSTEHKYNSITNFETTVTSMLNKNNHMLIKCIPIYHNNGGSMILPKDSPNFIELCKQIQTEGTYNFVCEDTHYLIFDTNKIINATECDLHTLTDTVIGFGKPPHYVKDYHNKLKLLENIKCKIIVNYSQKDNISVGNKYKFTYKIMYRGSEYEVYQLVSYTLIN